MLAACLVVHINIGSIFIWSLFKGPLVELFAWDPVDVSLTFSIMFGLFFASSVAWGKIQDRIGPRWVAMLCGLCFGLTFILASRISSLPHLYATIGVLGGLGVGSGYVSALSACLKWFPDKRGLVSGLILAGYGSGPVIFSGVADKLIRSCGILDTFMILGWLFGGCILVAAQFLKNPPPGYIPAGWVPGAEQQKTSGADYTSGEMVRTPQFWLIGLSFFLGANTGIMVVSNLVDIAVDNGTGMAVAVMMVSLFALGNTCGRIFGGGASDRWGRAVVLRGIFCVQAASLVSVYVLSGVVVTVPLFCISLAWGGISSIFPALTADYFGSRNLGGNYGLVLLLHGVGVMASPILYDFLKGAGGIHPLLFCASLACVGFCVTFILRPPARGRAVG